MDYIVRLPESLISNRLCFSSTSSFRRTISSAIDPWKLRTLNMFQSQFRNCLYYLRLVWWNKSHWNDIYSHECCIKVVCIMASAKLLAQTLSLEQVPCLRMLKSPPTAEVSHRTDHAKTSLAKNSRHRILLWHLFPGTWLHVLWFLCSRVAHDSPVQADN